MSERHFRRLRDAFAALGAERIIDRLPTPPTEKQKNQKRTFDVLPNNSIYKIYFHLDFYIDS